MPSALGLLAHLFGILGALPVAPAAESPAIAAPRLEHAVAAELGLPPLRATPRAAARDRAWMVLGDHGPTAQAIVGRFGAARLGADGPTTVDGGARVAWLQVGVAQARDEQVQIVVARGDLSLLLWVALDDLAPQLRRPAHIVEGAALDGVRAGIELAPGEVVHIERTRGGRHHVRTDDGIRGWIDADAFGPTFVPTTLAPTGSARTLHGPVAFHGSPGGKRLPIGPRARDATTRVHTLGPAGRGWIMVEYAMPCRKTMLVRGYVFVGDELPRPHRTPTIRCSIRPRVQPGLPAVGTHGAIVRVRADTELVDADGTLVGRVRRDRSFAVAADGGVLVETYWGPMRLWIGATLGPP